MDIILIWIYFVAFLTIISAFFNLKFAIATYIASLLLIPFWQIDIRGASMSYNGINIIYFLVFFYHYRIKQKLILDYTLVKPFLFLFITLAFFIPFQVDTPQSEQVKSLLISFLKVVPLSIVIFNVWRFEKDLVTFIKIALTISIFVASLYGILLTKMGGLNPYTSYISQYYGLKDTAESFSFLESRIGISNAGKIQSTTNHPMLWGLHLSLLFVIFLHFYLKQIGRFNFNVVILLLLGFNILVSGVRTSIAALLIGIFYYFFRAGRLKGMLIGFLLLIIALVVINVNEDVSRLFASFIDFSGKNSRISGSSISMRLHQLEGAFHEIRYNLLVGKGFGWDAYYRSLKGDHPVLLAFESFIFVALCNSGLLGCLIWVVFFCYLFRQLKKLLLEREDHIWIFFFCIVYLAYIIGTGDYGYMQFFAIYLTFFVCYLLNYNKNFKSNNIY